MPTSRVPARTGRAYRRTYTGWMSEEQKRREFGRDGVSGLVDRERALRARLLPQRDRSTEDRERFRRLNPKGR